MTREYTVSTRISEDLAGKLDKLSTALGRNKSYLLLQALQSYIASETQFIEAVEDGIRAYKAGEVIPHEQVIADWKHRYKTGNQ